MAIEPFKFECTACGKCCQWGGYVFLYPDDVTRIAEYLEMTPQAFCDKYTHHIAVEYTARDVSMIVPYLTLRFEKKSPCAFLEDKLCTIHPAKPFHCERSPLLAEFLLEEEGRAQFAKACKGMGKGPTITRPEIDNALTDQAERDMAYEDELEAHDWDLASLLGVDLPEAELIPDLGFEYEIED